MSDPYTDYFFNSNYNSKLNHSKSYSNLYKGNRRPSALNLSGSNIVYNNNKKQSITSHLKQNNLLARKQMDEINNEYNNMKSFLNDKVSKLERRQQMQFDSLKNYLEENDMLEKLRIRENHRNNMIKEIENHVEHELNKKKNFEKIRKLDYEERLERQIALENQEKEDFLREIDYLEKIKKLEQLEKRFLQNKKLHDMYNSMYYPNPFTFPGYFMNPFFLNLINANNNKQNDIMKLYLLKSLMEDDKPKKDHPFIMKPPKYLIQKYYPPAPNTNYIPVPQPILFKSPDYYPNILNKKRPSIKISLPSSVKGRKNSQYESIPTPQKRKHKHKHHSKHRNETPNEDEEEPEKSEEENQPDEDGEGEEKENKEEPEENEDNEDKENTEKEKEDEESSEPDVRLRLYDPDNPEENKIVYPS